MKRNEFLEFLAGFASRPIPATLNRHIYLWLGETEELIATCPTGFIQSLSLLALCKDITKTPLGEKAAGRVLSGAIEDWLLKNFPNGSKQQALLVEGLILLYRYHIPMSVFFQLTNERNMVILTLSELDVNFKPAKPLPSYVLFSPDLILKYARSEISEEAVVKED
jgi:hypothetical protein